MELVKNTGDDILLEDVDLTICFATVPPMIAPISERAKKWLALPKGAEAALIIGEVEEVFAALPEDYVLAHVDDLPEIVAVATIGRLH